jgi:hypothetical protein
MKHLAMNDQRCAQEFVRRAVHPGHAFRRTWLRLFVLGRFIPDTPVDRDLRTRLPHSKADGYLLATRKRITPVPRRR